MKKKSSGKSHVAMEYHGCPVCGVVHPTGAILMGKRLRGVFDPNDPPVTGWSLCSQDKQKYQEGFIAFIGIDPEKSGLINGIGDPDTVFRTGEVVHVKAYVVEELFGAEHTHLSNGKHREAVFCGPEIIAMFKKHLEKQPSIH